MCMLSITKVIYHKFAQGAAFYTLNGKNVNVMLELWFIALKERFTFCLYVSYKTNKSTACGWQRSTAVAFRKFRKRGMTMSKKV